MIDYHSAVIKHRMAQFLASKDFDPYFERLHLSAAGLWAMGLIAPLTVVGLPLAKSAWKKIWAGDARTARLRRRYSRLGQTGQIIFTYVVVTNSSLKYEEQANAPALVAGNFNNGRDDLRIMELRDTLAEHSLGMWTSTETKPLATLLEDLDYTFCRRRQIPSQFTGGIALTAFDLQIVGEYLPTKTLQIEAIPCIAEPGNKGLICMIPYFLIEDVMSEIEQSVGRN